MIYESNLTSKIYYKLYQLLIKIFHIIGSSLHDIDTYALFEILLFELFDDLLI